MRIARQAPLPAAKPVALVVPHAGWEYSGPAAAAAYRAIHPGDYERVVIVGPAHRADFIGFSLNEWDGYRTPLGVIPICAEAATLRDRRVVVDATGADREEHSIEIQLPLLQQRLGAFCLIPILAGRTTPSMEQRLAERLAALHDHKTLFVFSSDFIHYGSRFGFTPYGTSASRAREQILTLEQAAVDLIQAGDTNGFRTYVASTGATICGQRDLAVMLELLPKILPQARGTVLAHYASFDLPGSPGDDGVGYVSMAFSDVATSPEPAQPPMGAPRERPVCRVDSPKLDAATGNALVGLARSALQTQLRGSGELRRALEELPDRDELYRIQAAFVTLQRQGRLRGCVGQVRPEYPLVEAVVRSAVSAALNDVRFDPVTGQELEDLTVEVTALEPIRPVGSWRNIELGRHGIVLEQQGRRALFLPQVPGEHGFSLEQTLAALSRKAGLAKDAWRSPGAKFYVFGAQVFKNASGPAGSATARGSDAL
jgi:AmmeMemoRadiSam system protein B/AmmeMemoRadiSam system protein A